MGVPARGTCGWVNERGGVGCGQGAGPRRAVGRGVAAAAMATRPAAAARATLPACMSACHKLRCLPLELHSVARVVRLHPSLAAATPLAAPPPFRCAASSSSHSEASATTAPGLQASAAASTSLKRVLGPSRPSPSSSRSYTLALRCWDWPRTRAMSAGNHPSATRSSLFKQTAPPLRPLRLPGAQRFLI